MVRKMMTATVGLLGLVGWLAASSVQAQDARSDTKLLSAFVVDSDGNSKPVDSINLNGKKVGIGEAVEGGFVSNDSSESLVITLSGQGLVSFAPKTTGLLELSQAAARVQVCRCNCGGSRDTYPPKTAADCTALNGQTCENPAGTVRTLSKCGMTWVQQAAVAEHVATELRFE